MRRNTWLHASTETDASKWQQQLNTRGNYTPITVLRKSQEDVDASCIWTAEVIKNPNCNRVRTMNCKQHNRQVLLWFSPQMFCSDDYSRLIVAQSVCDADTLLVYKMAAYRQTRASRSAASFCSSAPRTRSSALSTLWRHDASTSILRLSSSWIRDSNSTLKATIKKHVWRCDTISPRKKHEAINQ